MRKLLIKELRERSCIPGKQKTWIAKLSDDQLYEIYHRIKNGEKAKSIARHVQKSWKIKSESKVHSLSQGILKFQKRIAELLEINPSDVNAGPPTPDSYNEKQLGSLETNEKIARDLRSRIQRILREEERTGVPFPSLSKEIQSLTAFEKAIIKQKQWALENPGDDPLTALEKRRLEGEIEEVFTEIVETVEYRERVLAFLKALLKAFHDEAEKNEIDSPEEILDE